MKFQRIFNVLKKVNRRWSSTTELVSSDRRLHCRLLFISTCGIMIDEESVCVCVCVCVWERERGRERERLRDWKIQLTCNTSIRCCSRLLSCNTFQSNISVPFLYMTTTLILQSDWFTLLWIQFDNPGAYIIDNLHAFNNTSRKSLQCSYSAAPKSLLIAIYHAQIRTVEPLYKDTPEMRTPPLIRTLEAVPRVSRTEGFHALYTNTLTVQSPARSLLWW